MSGFTMKLNLKDDLTDGSVAGAFPPPFSFLPRAFFAAFDYIVSDR